MRGPLIPILKPANRLLQKLIPPNSSRVCYLSRPDYCDNSFYMYRHLLRTRSGLEHVWPLMDMSLASRVRSEFDQMTARFGSRGHSLKVVPRGSWQAYYLFLTSRSIFHTHGVYPVCDRAYGRQIVSLWHGMPIKCVGRLNHRSPRPTPTFGNLHLATSTFFRYIIASAFGVTPEHVLISGLPRCDALTETQWNAHSREQICAELGIPSADKLVLWLPTYRTEGVLAAREGQIRSFLDDLEPWILAALNREAAAHACTLLIKLHPRDPLNYRPLDPSLENLRVLRAQEWVKKEIQLYDMLAVTDGLLSDVSSVLIDYLVTHRPIGIIGFKADTYTRDLTFPAEWLLMSARYQQISGEIQVSDFFESVRQGKKAPMPENDTAQLFYEQPEELSAEIIARRIGL